MKRDNKYLYLRGIYGVGILTLAGMFMLVFFDNLIGQIDSAVEVYAVVKIKVYECIGKSLCVDI